MKRRAFLFGSAGLVLPGCEALPGILSAASRGASVLAAAIDAGDSGQQVYFARHPSPERESTVLAIIHKARLAQVAYDAALAATKAADDGNLAEAKKKAIETYNAMYELLKEFGILDAKGPPGGAESEDAPIPEPFQIPKDAAEIL